MASGGTIGWSSFLGGNSSDYGYAIALDSADDAYVTGYTYSTDFPSTGGFDTTLGGQDAFVTKITNGPASSSVAWSSFLGGSGSDLGQAIAVDAAGNAYLTGYTNSVDFPSAGGFDTAVGGFQDAFVAKVDSTGATLAWSSYLGGENSSDYGSGIAADGAGGAHVFGYTFSNDFPTVGGFDMGYNNGDAFVTKVDPSGATLEWSSYLGGGSTDYGRAIALGPDDNVFVTGDTYSTNFPVYLGFDFTNGGSSDAYVARIVVCGNIVCEFGEDPCNCPSDCGADTCGNGCCGSTEDCHCGDCLDLCGNGCCGLTESPCTCPGDCGADTCGNACCGPTEGTCDCAQDCGNECGNGCCNEGENSCFCPGDCGEDVCGNGCQGPGETACNCEEDTLDLCGDDCCTGEETCVTCDHDCACAEPAPDGGGGEVDPGGCGCRLGSRPEAPAGLVLAILLAVARRRRPA